MDYSAITHDPDHPAGSDPWGSPRPDQVSFPASATSDIPSSPLPGNDHSAEGVDGPAEGQSPDLSAQLQNAQINETSQPAAPAQQSPAADQQRSQLPARYQTGVRQPSQHPQPQQQPRPQYKIQAKITGLERTGKKDPILRFDVHVGCPQCGINAPSKAIMIPKC